MPHLKINVLFCERSEYPSVAAAWEQSTEQTNSDDYVFVEVHRRPPLGFREATSLVQSFAQSSSGEVPPAKRGKIFVATFDDVSVDPGMQSGWVFGRLTAHDDDYDDYADDDDDEYRA